MHSITAVYLVTLFYAFHYALPLYSESSYLESIIPLKFVGIIYSAGAFLSLIVTLKIGFLLERFSNRKVLLIAALLETLSLIGLATSTSVFGAILYFIAHTVLLGVMYVALNILVESVSKDTETGRVRGVYLTILNLGILTGPFFAAKIVDGGFNMLFISAALCIIPMLYILYTHLDHLQEPRYITPRIQESLKELKRFPNIRRIVFAQYILEFFFITMIVYAPIYLISNSILTLQTYLGLVIPIVLIPFIIVPYPVGHIADKKLGEKELLIVGTFLMIVGSILFALIKVPILIYFIFALFVARLGASMVEEMASSYFYKQINASQANIISIFTNTRNIALITGPLLGSLIIYLFSLQTVFFVLAGILTLSLIPAFKIHDTR